MFLLMIHVSSDEVFNYDDNLIFCVFFRACISAKFKNNGLYEMIFSKDSFFTQGIYNLLGIVLINNSFIIIDLDSLGYEQLLTLRKNIGNIEIVAFASNDISYYKKIKTLGDIIVLDKKSRINDIFLFFCNRNESALYRPKKKLTLKEFEVFQLLISGVDIINIMRAMNISRKSFYHHRSKLIMKFDCQNRITFLNLLTF